MERHQHVLQAIHRAPLVPVLAVKKRDDAIPLVEALFTGGITAVEVTLRTPVALEVIRDMKSACPEIMVGAGTVRTQGDVDACIMAGADFIVSPGTSPALATALKEAPVLAVPGASSVTEVIMLADMGFDRQKFFPAEACGGASFLKSIAGPVPDVSFMPTGGIAASEARHYLALRNVFAIGGSWLAPADVVEARDWSGIRDLCRKSLAMIFQGESA